MDFLLKKRVLDTLNEHLTRLRQQKVNGIESTKPGVHTAFHALCDKEVAEVKQLIADVEAEPIAG